MLRAVLFTLLTGICLPLASSAQGVFLNELHYDNASTDSNEAVEVAGPAGTDLTGWSVVLYNGNGGASYATLPLSGTIANTCAGFGAVSVLAPGIQNGSPDGVALVNALGTAVQFLSYEGSMVAAGGPANGMTSVDIGVSENGTGAATSSLHLVGTGTTYPDFAWTEATASMGACNTGQTFVGGIDSPPAVFASTPANGATGVSYFANLSVTFTEEVTAAPGWYALTCATSGPVTSAQSGGPRTYTLNPDVNLAPGEACTLTITASAITDLDGTIDAMSSNATIDFTIAPDVAPTVSQTQPTQGASAVSVTSNVVVTFSEPVSVTPSAFDLNCTASGVHGASVSGGPTVYTLDPAVDFGYLETCTLTVIATSVTDLDGSTDPMAADATISWGTGQSIGDYYATADPSTAATLRTTLNNIIDDHTRFPYTSGSTDTWDIVDQADEDPINPARVLDVYKNESYPKAGAGNASYNREHRWAKSFGFPDDTSNSWAYTDTHHLIVSNSGYNSARNNRYFDNCPDTCTEYPTTVTNGLGGGSGTYPGNSNWGKGERWETWDYRKGDVARALLYMDIRYEGGTNLAGAPEPDLVLTNDPALIQTTGVNTTGIAYLGLLCVLVEWHLQDLPDENERLRNALIQSYQQNRNPFVDHPEWASVLWGDICTINQAPTLGNGSFGFFENRQVGYLVTTLAGSDPDAGQSLSYQLVSGNTGGAFAVNAVSGQLTVANSAALNFEVTPVFALIVRATDDGSPNLSDDATIIIGLSNVEEGSAQAANDAEGATEDGGTIAVNVLANDTSDPDGGTLAVIAVNDPANGTATFTALSVSYAPDANFCGSDAFDYQINGGVSATITVIVTCVNDAPATVGSLSAQSAQEGVTIAPFSIVGGFADIDVGDDLDYSQTGLPSGLTLDMETGEITGTPAIGSAAGSVYTVTITATDGDDEAQQSFQYTVTSVAPSDLRVFGNGFE